MVLGTLRLAAFSRPVVKGFTQSIPAKIFPVAAGIAEVEVPSLVHSIRRGNHMARYGGEIEKAPVFLKHSLRVSGIPSILFAQALGEFES